MTNDFLANVARTVSRHELLAAGDTVIAAVSGGPDSTCLLMILNDLRREYDLTVIVWHLNHLMRAEASAEAEFVRAVCADLGLRSIIEERDVKQLAAVEKRSLQEAGRVARYERLRWWREELGADKIAVGHTYNDSVETFFINLLRGTGLAGLTGIPAKSGAVIRPLIEAGRPAVLEYLHERAIPYVQDPSNEDSRYLRTRVRTELLPALESSAPGFMARITGTIQLLQEDERCLHDLAAAAFARLVRRQDDYILLSITELRRLDQAIVNRVTKLATQTVDGLSRLSEVDYRRAKALYERGAGEAVIAGSVLVYAHSQDIIYCRPKKKMTPITIDKNGGTFKIDGHAISVTITSRGAIVWPPGERTLVIDADKIQWPMTVRSRAQGDWFFPLGMSGRKKLQDFFVDRKTPRHERNAVPVFADVEKIVAVGLVRPDERAKVKKQTTNVVVIKLEEA